MLFCYICSRIVILAQNCIFFYFWILERENDKGLNPQVVALHTALAALSYRN